MGRKAKERNIIMKLLSRTVQALGKARDFYVKCVTDFNGMVDHDIGMAAMVNGPVVQISSFPRSYSAGSSVSSNDEDFSRILKLASRGSDKLKPVKGNMHEEVGKFGFRRSYSVGVGKIGRIEEDNICSFREAVQDAKEPGMAPRSRSYAGREKVGDF